MAIEVVIRSAASDGIPVRQAASHLSLDTATDILLDHNAPGLTGYSKHGPDLQLNFADGQTLYIQNFFVLGPQGQYSQLIDHDGTAAVSGLMAPEPEPDDTSLFSQAAGAGDPLVAPGAEGTEAGDGHSAGLGDTLSQGGADAGADWSNPLLLTGLGLASGYGTTSLIMSDGDSSGSSATHSAAGESAAADVSGDGDLAEAAGDDGSSDDLDQEIAALVGTGEDEADLSHEIAALTETAGADTPPPAPQDEQTAQAPAETAEEPQQAGDFLDGLIGELQDAGFADMAHGVDFAAAMTVEADI